MAFYDSRRYAFYGIVVDVAVKNILFLLGEDLLYLLDQPHTQGNVKCDAADSNYKHFEVSISIFFDIKLIFINLCIFECSYSKIDYSYISS